jgi:RNA polymerase sigma-70 factor, ECF subfamily
MPLTFSEEKDLIERARSGDEQAFESLILAFSTPLYRVVLRMANDSQEAEAVVQEAFWRAWRSLDRYKNDRPFFPYLVTVALNIQRDRWRANRRLEEWGLEEEDGRAVDPFPAPEKALEEDEKVKYLTQAIRNLPPVYRMVIALKYEANMNYDEIAKTMNTPVNTIKTYLHRAKLLLRQKMEEYNG